ncbi:MAG: hypothetical protein ACKVTZ_16585 [Bacteroidia bacterium]
MKYFYLFLACLLAQPLLAQKKLPIIKATSSNVSIRDGQFLDKDAWTLAPEAKPDIFTADRTRKPKWVVFYTDIDSIRIKVKPNTSFDFMVLLNNKDTCYTRVLSAISENKAAKKAENRQDTIPFCLTTYDAIHVKALVNQRDSLNLHFDLGAFDVRLTQAAILKKTQLLAHQPDALAGKAKPNFNNMQKVSSLTMGTLTLTEPAFSSTMQTAQEMDGRFGWNVFEGKIVEMDYDKNLLIVHTKLPKKAKKYAAMDLTFLRSFPCIKGELSAKNKKYEGYFIMDTGSNKAMMIDSTWAAKLAFPQDLPLLKFASFQNPRGVVFQSKIVACPQFNIQTFSMENVPTTLLGSQNPTNFEVNLLGNDVLKRFNMILDFKHDRIYLQPNHLMKKPFKEAS